jgi:two-component system sensor histidine kinase KdpD
MVCMSSFPTRASELLRRGSRLAGRLNTDWFVVYVETPREAPNLIDAEAQRHLLANAERARELGAEVVHLKGDDPVAVLLDFARSHGVGQIIIGRSQAPWWRQIFGRSVVMRLIREAAGFDVLIASLDEEPVAVESTRK